MVYIIERAADSHKIKVFVGSLAGQRVVKSRIPCSYQKPNSDHPFHMQSNERANLAHERSSCMRNGAGIDHDPQWNPSLAFNKRNWRKPYNQDSQFSWCEPGTWWKWERRDKHTLTLGSLIYKRLITETSLLPPPSHWCGLPALNNTTVSTLKYNNYLPCTKIVNELKNYNIISHLTKQFFITISILHFQFWDQHLGTGIGEQLWKELKVLLWYTFQTITYTQHNLH